MNNSTASISLFLCVSASKKKILKWRGCTVFPPVCPGSNVVVTTSNSTQSNSIQTIVETETDKREGGRDTRGRFGFALGCPKENKKKKEKKKKGTTRKRKTDHGKENVRRSSNK
ncbi:hypothetical protein MLD38_012882 [Melastoma candidum]|uniref:Uncharacterized protein n=1 Tax=Melastoma candidum TaxID=119954 RepID=A0ACB9R7R5_9MYRT|nr:hypothetical protein MLD38_012882 [Melastoma candidum]